MEFNFATLYPSLPFLLAEKAAMFPMEAMLNNTQSDPMTPKAWLQFVRQNDPDGQYVVTTVAHYKKYSLWPSLQHEYINLFVQQRPSPHHPPLALDTFLLTVSRTITGPILTAQLGLWGPAKDTVAVRDPVTDNPDKRLGHITWALEDAPCLSSILFVITLVHLQMPTYCVLKTSCYTFVAAIAQSIDLIFNGDVGTQQQGPFLVWWSYFSHCFPSGIRQAESVAALVAKLYQLSHYKPEGRDEGNDFIPYQTTSWFKLTFQFQHLSCQGLRGGPR